MNAIALSIPTTQIETATDEFPLLGYTVIASLAPVAVRHEDLRQLLAPLGLERYLPGLPEARTALRRALQAWLTDLAGSAAEEAGLGADEDEVDHRTRQLIREIVAPRAPVLTLALVAENVDLSQLGLSYLTNVRVFYDRSTGQLYLTTTPTGQFDPFQLTLASSPRDQALLARLRPFWEYYRELHVASDLGRMVQAIIADMDATALRPGGGVSFVPYQQRAALQRLKELVELRLPAPPGGANTGSLLHLPVIDRPATRAHMARVVHQALLGEVAALQKDLERFVEQAQSTTENRRQARVRPATIVSRLAEYRTMRAKIELYGEILGECQQQALQALGQLQQTARNLLETAAGALADTESPPEAAGNPAGRTEVLVGSASR